MRGLPLPALLALGLAGCLAVPGPAVLDAAGFEAPAVLPSGATAHDLLHAFAMGHPYRHAERPESLEAARDYLRGALAAMGVPTREHAYREGGVNLLGVVPGTSRPDEWIVLSCHYDTHRNAVYGARDDGLGCAALLEMARSFPTRAWNRTLVFAFFDQEESGLVGSRAFVRDFGGTTDQRLAANLNFDPAGLHWPCGDALGKYDVILVITESKLAGAEAVAGYAHLLDAVRDGFLSEGVPEESVRVETRHAYLRVAGNPFLPPGSDDDAFDEADVPSIWVGAPPVDRAGPVEAWGYPNHTPTDTAALVEARCGSAELLREGLGTAMNAAYRALAAVDGAPADA